MGANTEKATKHRVLTARRLFTRKDSKVVWTWTEPGFKKRIRLDLSIDKFLLNVLTDADRITLAQTIDGMMTDALRVAVSNLDKSLNHETEGTPQIKQQ